jgi:hypothetical protein
LVHAWMRTRWGWSMNRLRGRCGWRMRMGMHYTSTTQQPNNCNYNLIHLKSPVLHKVRKNLRRFLRADQIVE